MDSLVSLLADTTPPSAASRISGYFELAIALLVTCGAGLYLFKLVLGGVWQRFGDAYLLKTIDAWFNSSKTSAEITAKFKAQLESEIRRDDGLVRLEVEAKSADGEALKKAMRTQIETEIRRDDGLIHLEIKSKIADMSTSILTALNELRDMFTSGESTSREILTRLSHIEGKIEGMNVVLHTNTKGPGAPR